MRKPTSSKTATQRKAASLAKTRARDNARYAKDRAAIFKLLGRHCPCGVKDTRCLQIDHRYGGGTKFRRLGGSWPRLHADIRKHPSIYRLLCANCNCIARIEQGQNRKPTPRP